MQANDLIESTLRRIKSLHYGDSDLFWRHRQHLIKAISRFGVECVRRGWNPDDGLILDTIMGIVKRIKRDEVDFLPLYLEHAVDRAVRARAEEIAARSRRELLPKTVKHLVNGVMVVDVVREQTNVEQLASLHSSLTKRLKRRKATAKQLSLF